jgi:hypothetical protein
MIVEDLLGLVIHQDASVEINPTWVDKRYVLLVGEAISVYSDCLVLGIGNAKDNNSIFSILIN